MHFEILAEFTITYNFIPRECSYVHEIKQPVDETKYLGLIKRNNENVDKDVCRDEDRKCSENDHNIGVVEALTRKEGAKNKTVVRTYMNVTLLSRLA